MMGLNMKMVYTALFLALTLTVISFKPAGAEAPLPTILIQADGTVEPANVPIQRSGDTYTFTDNIYGAIKIEKSNVVLDGAGYTLSGSFNGTSTGLWVIGAGPYQPNASLAEYIIGVDMGKNVDGVTVENLNLENFSIGMYIWTKNNTVTENSVSNSIVGILLSGSDTDITKNILSNNQMGLFFGFNTPGDIPYDITISQNSFEHNVVQLQGCQCKVYNLSESIHNWDNGVQGNYWSNYNGTDANHDNLGDTPYTIDPLDQDRYPLMQSIIQLPVPVKSSPQPFPIELALLGVSIPVLLAVVVFAFKRRTNHKASTFVLCAFP
jgi:parallel beta-helix repeat protein